MTAPLAWAATAGLAALLAGAYLALGVRAIRVPLARRAAGVRARELAGPAVLLAAVGLYSAAAGLPVGPRLAGFAAYLLPPALLLGAARHGHPAAARLGAVALLWLPIELRLLPALPLPPGGTDVSRFVGLVAALYLFLVARPLPGVGYTWRLSARDAGVAVAGFAAFAAVALPVGFATGFIRWSPDLSWDRLPLLAGIFLAIGVPEEFLFRGLIQNLLRRPLGRGAALAVASGVFGLAHLPDPRYVLLAAFAGVAYGWVFLRTRTITAAAVTHALVDWVWVLLLGGG